MHVLFLHNRYRQSGGEDAVVRSEIDLLRSRSVKVTEFELTNEADEEGWRNTIQLGLSASWSWSSHRKIREICAEVRPDIAHVHNFWMRLSPAVHYACKQAGVPTVQTLHNFRLLCVKADFLREGKICQDCLGHVPWRGVVRRCYRDSLAASAVVAGMISTHRSLGTWRTQVDAFIALSEHSKSKFVEGGIPADKIFVKRNFLDDSALPTMPPSSSNVLLFVGRLSEEKGVDLLLRGWREIRKVGHGVLRIIGDGPLRQQLELQARDYGFSSAEVHFTGTLPYAEVLREVGKARGLVLPSLCFENCPRTLIEAFCSGRPVLVPDRGSLDELVRDGQTGLKFVAGDEHSLSEVASRFLAPSAPIDIWGASARREYLSQYTPDASFESLMRIYRFAKSEDTEPANQFPVMLRG